jgi:hypothetical protein
LTTKDQGVISREPQKPTTPNNTTPQKGEGTITRSQIQVHILGNCFL